MSQFVKRNGKGRCYIVGKQYSGETYTTIFKIALEYKEEV